MKRVLIVDDSETNRFLLSTQLKDHGFAVMEARHGAEALVKARQSPPDLAISDLLMPVMDGYTLLRHWKADPGLKTVPFIVYTATYTDPKDEQLARELRADAFIVKPAEPEHFMTRVAQALAADSAERLTPPALPVADEKVVLKEYSETLAHKLEEKIRQLEVTKQELKQTTDELVRSEGSANRERNLIKAVLSSLPGVFYFYDEALRIQHWNDNFERITGYSGEEIAQMSPLDFFAGPDKALVKERIDEVFAKGYGSVEADLVAKDGTRTPFYFTGVRTEIGGKRYLAGVGIDISARRKAEAELVDSERRFREIFESANVGIAVAGPDYRFLAVNAWFSEVLGYSRDELLQRHTLDVVHPDDVEESLRMRLAVHRGETTAHRAERRYIRKDGSVVWVSVFATTVFDDAGRERYSIGVISDITERKRAEDAVRASEARFRRLFEQAGDGIFVISTEHRYLDVNASGAQMLGYTRDDLLKMGVADVLSAHERSRLDPETAHMRTGRPHFAKWDHQRKDGSVFPAEVSACMLDDKSYLAIVRDISQRVQGEHALRLFRTLLDRTNDAIEVIDPATGRFLDVNDRLCRDLGYSHEEMLSLRVVDIDPSLDAAKWARNVRELQRSGTAIVEGVHQRRDGTTFPVEISANWLHVDRDYIIAILRDITDRKHAEDRIRRLNRVRAVTSEINALMVRERDRMRLFERLCDIALRCGQFHLAWVGVVDRATLEVKAVAMAGPEADCRFIRQTPFNAQPQRPDGGGMIGIAVRSRELTYENDLATGPDRGPGLAELCHRGYRSVVSLPLLVQEDCIAVIVLYSTEAGIFDQDELTLLAELSEDISFALSYIDQEEKAHHAAYHDPVTGLGNRAFLYERLGVAVRKATAKGHACALMLLDIINFNEINSALGHANGDLLLKQFAERLRTKLWESDAVACLGGDEFAVLLPRLADSEDIRLVTGKVASALRSDFVVASVAVSVDVRMGYAVYPAQADSPELLWQRAAIALREARRRNQDRVHYDPAMDRYDPRQLALLGELRQAIDSNELVLHYQPKIDLRKGTVMGAEALVRWQHPARGMIYPDAFIPLAERTSSLIVLLTTWVAANAMRQGRVWQRAGLELDIAVNLSVRNLHHPDLVSEFLDIARSAKFPLDRVTLEITENAIMADPARGKAVLSELHGAGIRFSMDDFGIGQSSLTYLKDLPIAQLKIDKSFVIGFREPRNRAIVQAALELGHSLGMEVTAEGIEDVATCDSLREMGCDIGQGYYISKPLPPDQFLEWCRTSAWGVHRKKPVRRTRSGGKSGTKGKSKRVGKRSGRRR